MRLTFPLAEFTAGSVGRTIAGLAAPWDVPGFTSAGKLTLIRGSITIPDDLSAIKLMDYHQNPPAAIGYCTTAEDTDAGLFMAFQLGTTPACQLAVTEAAEGLRDGLSVELVDVKLDSTDHVLSSILTGVALVPVPAFASARVTQVAASHHPNTTQEGPTMPEPTTTDAAAPAVSAAVGDIVTIGVTGPIVTDSAPADTGAPAAAATATEVAAAVVAQLTASHASSGRPAAAPMGLTGVHHGTAPALPAEVAAALHRVMIGQTRPELEAALSDITNTDVFGTIGQDAYVGQLWSSVTFARRFVPLLRPGTLTSWKVKGWRWVTKPEVGDYAGDKTAIPSGVVDVEPAEATAARLAGGHDLDRKFRDFGDTEFLDAYLAAMTESYARKSDAKALAFILASASTPAGNATAGGGSVIDAAILAASLLEEQTDGGSPDYFLVNRADLRALGGVTEQNRKAYLELFGVDPAKFLASNLVTAGTVIAGMTGAGTFYELGGPPIRVEALDIARGGIDEALFGYWATLLHDAKGIVKATITA